MTRRRECNSQDQESPDPSPHGDSGATTATDADPSLTATDDDPSAPAQSATGAARSRSSNLTPEQRSQRARLAAHSRWAMEPDRSAATAAARRGWHARFEREVDPEGVLSPRERAIRAESAKKAHYLRMAMKSVKARKRNRAA